MAAIRAACCSAGIALLAACSGVPDTPDPTTTTAAVAVESTSTEPAAAPNPTSTTTTTTAPPPTTLAVGLPASGLGIPDADGLSLGGGSGISNGITVRGVPLAEVRAWVEQQLVAGGWQVTTVDPLDFTGPGAAGTVTFDEIPPDLVEVSVRITAPPA